MAPDVRMKVFTNAERAGSWRLDATGVLRVVAVRVGVRLLPGPPAGPMARRLF